MKHEHTSFDKWNRVLEYANDHICRFLYTLAACLVCHLNFESKLSQNRISIAQSNVSCCFFAWCEIFCEANSFILLDMWSLYPIIVWC